MDRFDTQSFIGYIEGKRNVNSRYLRDTLESIIEYANKHEQVSKDQFAYFLSDILPDIEFGEAAMFMDDGCLTENGLAAKNEWLEKLKGEQTYDVGMKVEGRFYAFVRAKDLEEARKKAREAYEDADFGDLECIDMEVINATDSNGNIHDYI